ncbi:tRNA (adenosine(37)-N6)-dimethylallyltransferase MiaA [uncultured Treponema sp.]|uniref:tRNA (adenosine(37)-N6)-dimethylallyltransferase MiaA n=1 Tax=uncultured Treponema sp. TaxID=162155 RepID=UPI00280B2583|nr:tRNA (adenosine(37)-N6)-dimethylallyltransferase MiaA [uncultured Treponema sp.]
MQEKNVNCVVLLGPTAVGKTAIAVRLADRFGWDIISADSRQVYKGLDLGSGKDLSEYSINGKQIPYHLIDIATLDSEYNVFCFQQDFYRTFNSLKEQGKFAFVAGGTGMYLDSVVRSYDLLTVPENPEQKEELEKKSLEELGAMLLSLKPELHNKSDLAIKERVVKALQIELFKASPEGIKARSELLSRPKIEPLVIGTTLDRDELYRNIEIRLRQRIQEGMIEEVENLHKQFSWERLEKLGLEYRFVSFYLEGKISSKEEMEKQLCASIRHFAKRQETWFRGMERKGVKIHWLPRETSKEARYLAAVELIEKYVPEA